MKQIIVIVDPGSDSLDLAKVVLDVPFSGGHLDLTFKKIMEGGIFDALNNVWYPPHQVRRVEYGTA